MTLVDQTARDAIRDRTDATLFVEAGAGSGKTTALVGRILTLVLHDGVPLSAIAAVTFTEKAGAELRDRLRAALEKRRGTSDGRAEAALDALDAAAIGTLHAFAQRILTEHPIEARIPPLIEVLDEVGSSVAFAERWNALLTDLLDDPEMERPVLLGLDLGVQLQHIRSLATLLGKDWDLIGERVLADEPTPLVLPDLKAFADRGRRALAAADECTDPGDNLYLAFQQLQGLLERLETAPNEAAALAEVQAIGELKYSNGKKKSWTCDIEEARDVGKALAAEAKVLVQRVVDECLRRIVRWLGARVRKAAEGRRAEGRLEFHDLLVLARDLLRHDGGTRAALHEQYERILLDEFQDTDPIQIELAVRIAGGAKAGAADWADVVVPDGRLFVVGDPKQSIYRFRRASIETYLDARSRIGEKVALTVNFRTVDEILGWVNGAFAQLIVEQAKAQPAFVALDPDPKRVLPHESGPAVVLLGAEGHSDLPRAAADLLREREAKDVARAVRRVQREGWLVLDEHTKQWRTARLADVAVLVPARTSLPFLQDALDAAGVPYRAEASSLVYQAQEVRDLLAAARAIADPGDRLSLVTALRSPLFGCGDDDLWTWKRDGGSFSLLADIPEALRETPVGIAMHALKDLANGARWRSPSEVLGAIVADRRMLEVAAERPRGQDTWRRLRFVVDQARAWSEASQGGLRAYLAWAAYQGEEASRVAEAVLPETDLDAVRVMTIHAAKGLEFPIVILSGMTSQPPNRTGVNLLWPSEGGFAVKVGGGVETEDFATAAPIDEQMGSLERIRLLYVAATRARDHLVVSLHRDGVKSTNSAAATIAAVLLPEQLSWSGYEVDDDVEEIERPVVAPPPDHEAWLSAVEAARASTREASAHSASGLEGTAPELVLAEATEREQGAAKGQRDAELPPWTKGRYGSAIGRAVHGVLQVVDLAAGPSAPAFDAAVQAQSAAEGVIDQTELVGRLAASALRSDVVRRAAAAEHWRETFVGTMDGDTVLEGFIDLLYREDDDALVVVDYKTDAVPAGGISSRVAYYRPQIEAYLRGIRDATGAEARGVLVFLHPEGSVEEEVR